MSNRKSQPKKAGRGEAQSPPQRAPTISKRTSLATTVAIALGLAAIASVVYSPALHFGYINFDDTDYVTANPHVLTGLGWNNVLWAFTTGWAANWFPLTWLSHMLDVSLYGLNAGGHHLTSLLLHAANSALLFAILRRMTGNTSRSAFVAALFAVHPLHVESVAWVAERKDVLSTFFWMLTVWAYIGYSREPRPRRYIPVLAFFLLGLMAKAMLVTLPFLLLLLDYWPIGRTTLRTDLNQGAAVSSSGRLLDPANRRLPWEKLPLFALAALSSAITWTVQRRGGSVISFTALPLSFRLENALLSYVRYIEKMLWPVHLAAFYPYPQSISGMWVGVAMVVLTAISALAIVAARRYPFVFVGWFWYLVALAPVIGLIQVGDQAMADRYTYVPLIGLFLIAAWGIPEFAGRWRQPSFVLPVLAVAVVLACAGVTRRQVGFWRDSVALWTHAIAVTNSNDFAHNNLGAALSEEGRAEEAAVQFTEAIQIRPAVASPHFNLGTVLARLGRTDEAMVQFRKALAIRPNYPEAHNNLGAALAVQRKLSEAAAEYKEALRLRPDFPEAHFSLGIALANMGRRDEAIAEYAEALRLRPGYAEVHNRWGALLASEGKPDQAIAHYREALRLNPAYADAQNNWGVALANQGKLEEAVEHYHEALRINPDYADAHNNYGSALAHQGNMREAVEQFSEALRLQPASAAIHSNLGLVLADQGRVEEAIGHFEAALQLNPSDVQARSALQTLSKRLASAESRNALQAPR